MTGVQTCALPISPSSVKISEMAAEGKDKVKELDINPVFITEDGAAIADALLVLYDD